MNFNTPKMKDGRKAPFVWCHLEALDLLKGQPSTLCVYMHIIRRAGHEGTCWESVSGMAETVGLSSKTVKACLKTLLELGMISRRSRPGYTSEYLVTDPEDWTPPQKVPREKITPGGGVKITPGGGVDFSPLTRSPELDPKELSIAAASDGSDFPDLDFRDLDFRDLDGDGQDKGSQATIRPPFPVDRPIAKFRVLANVPPRPGFEDYVEVAGYPAWCGPHCWFWYVRAINEEMAKIGKADQTPGALHNAFLEGKKHGFWKRWEPVYMEMLPDLVDYWPEESPYDPPVNYLALGG